MKKYFGFYILVSLIICNFAVFQSLYDHKNRDLTVAFLDVGQGDAIYIRTPSGKQMLIDGGASDGVVLRELGKVMPFYDRSIDVVLATHPDQDHIGGLNGVLERYKVGLFVRNNMEASTAAFENLVETVGDRDIKEEIVTRLESIDFGDGAHFDIIFPDKDVSSLEPNESSIVGKLVYGESSFMLTGDSPIDIERYLIKNYGSFLDSDVLKAGHHGSKTSSSHSFVETVSPDYTIISAGLDNRYNHPSPETMETLKKFQTKILQTLGQGGIIFRSDGENLTLLPQLF